METTEQVKLSKHLSAAVNAIQKEIDKKRTQANKFHEKALFNEHQSSVLIEEIAGLEEQQAKLKGE